jgi:predicted nucleic acid-binding protein
MNVKYFLDTNIFIYSFDHAQPEKKERSQALISEALQTGAGLISTQVIQEFFSVALGKFVVPLKPEDCKLYLQTVLAPICRVFPDEALYESALDVFKETGYSFYDALILAGALRGGAAILFSEDLSSGHQIGGVKVVNPFE